MDTKGGKPWGRGDGGVLNWAIWIDMYTLMCIKLMTNKNVLYKKINKIKFKNQKKKKRILSTVLSTPWNTHCKYPGGACRMNESMNKQAHSFQTCGHMSNLTFSEVKLLEGAHFLNVFSIESSQKMNSYKVLPPHFP